MIRTIKILLALAPIALLIIVVFGCTGAPTAKPDSVLSPPGTRTTVILVRHAERAKEHGDSALTPAGRQRARDLVAAVGNRKITAIYSPDRGRNRETVQPLATYLGVPITLIPEARLSNTRKFSDEFVREVLSIHAGGLVLWSATSRRSASGAAI